MTVFSIAIKEVYTTSNYIISIKPVSKREEHYVVQRGAEKYIISSNRPLFRSKGIRRRRPEMKWIEGHQSNIALKEKICDAIWAYVSSSESSGTL